MSSATSTTMTAAPTPTPSLVIGGPSEVDSDNCKLMGPFALFVQAMMGILVIASLIYKRQRETPKRKWKIWMLDVSKQMLGQLFVHILNVVLSDFVASGGGENPCSLYFLNILVDTTVGVFFIYITLRLITHLLTDVWGKEGFVSGQYTSTSSARHRNRPRIEYWLKQLASYLFVLLLMKMAVLLLFAIFPFLFDMGSWLLGLFGNHKQVQVLFSMALFPLAMNIVQFWLIDSLLRHNPHTSAYAKTNDSEFIVDEAGADDQESLLRDSSESYAEQQPAASSSDRQPDSSPPRKNPMDKLRIQARRSLSDSGSLHQHRDSDSNDQLPSTPPPHPPPLSRTQSMHLQRVSPDSQNPSAARRP